MGPSSIYTFHSDTNKIILAHTLNHRTSTAKPSVIIILLFTQEWTDIVTCYGLVSLGIEPR